MAVESTVARLKKNSAGFAFEKMPISRYQQDQIKLAYLMDQFICIKGDELRVSIKELGLSIRLRKKNLSKLGRLEEIGRELGIRPACLARMWAAWLRELETLEDDGFPPSQAWKHVSDECTDLRNKVLDAARGLHGQMEWHLFERPWEPEYVAVTDALGCVAELESNLKRLNRILQKEKGRYGEPLAPLTHGRPMAGLTHQSRRDLKTLAMKRAGRLKMTNEVLREYAEPTEDLRNPDVRAIVRARVHTALSNSEKWLQRM